MKVRLFALILLVFGIAIPAQAQEQNTTALAFIVDSSGSMRATFGSGTRLAQVRQALTALAEQLPTTYGVSLWAYGHRTQRTDASISCLDVQALVRVPPDSLTAFPRAISSLVAGGYTPISGTLEQVAAAMRPGDRNIAILISDGEENCGGDPCAIAAQLAASDVDLQVNTIGLGVDAQTAAQLQCIADVSGGTYANVDTPDALEAALKAASGIGMGTLMLVDTQGRRLDWLAFTATAEQGGQPVSGRGTISVPAGSYTIVTDTQPPAEFTAQVTADQIARITVDANGVIQAIDENEQVVTDMVLVVSDPQTLQVLHTGAGSIGVRPGTYKVALAAEPPFETTVTVGTGQRVSVTVVREGKVMVVDERGNERANLSLFASPAGANEVVASGTGSLSLLAGQYTVVVNSSPVLRRTVTITAGHVTRIPIADDGAIEVVSSGSVRGDLTIDVRDPESGMVVVSAQGRVSLLPGTYQVTVPVSPPLNQTVIVRARETLQLAVDETAKVQVVSGDALRDDVRLVAVDPVSGEVIAAGSGSIVVRPGTYTIDILTNPPLHKEVTVAADEVRSIAIEKNGVVRVVSAGAIRDDISLIAWNPVTDEPIVVGAGQLELLPGTYVIEVLSTPRLRQEVTLKAEDVVDIPLAANGFIEVATGGTVRGDVFFTVRDAQTRENVTAGSGMVEVIPGQYEVALDTRPPLVRTVTVASGEKAVIELPPYSKIQVKTGDAVRTDVTFHVYDAVTKASVSTGAGELEILPGDYLVQIDTIPRIEMTVKVAADSPARIDIPASGQIVIVDPQGNTLLDVLFVVFDPATGETLGSATGSMAVLPGTYEVRIIDPATVHAVTIAAGETESITVTR